MVLAVFMYLFIRYNNNLYLPSRPKQYTKYKRIKNYKTKPKMVDKQCKLLHYAEAAHIVRRCACNR